MFLVDASSRLLAAPRGDFRGFTNQERITSAQENIKTRSGVALFFFCSIGRASRRHSVSVLKRRTNSPTMQVRANSLTMRSIVPHVRRTRDWLSTVRSPGRPHTNFSRPDVPIAPSLRPRQAIGSTMNVAASAPTLRRAVRRASPAAAASPKVRSRESGSRSASPVSRADADGRQNPRPRARIDVRARSRAGARLRSLPRSPADLSLTPFDALFR